MTACHCWGCVCVRVCVCVWVWQTHKMPHSCCKICGHSSMQKPNHPPHPIPLSTGPRLKWITNPQKKNVRNFTLIWLNGFIGFDICSFVDPFRSLNFVLILLLLLPLFLQFMRRSVFGLLYPNSTLRYPLPLPFPFYLLVQTQSCKAFFVSALAKRCSWIWYVNHILCFIFCASTIWLPNSALLRYLSAGQKGVKSGAVWCFCGRSWVLWG